MAVTITNEVTVFHFVGRERERETMRCARWAANDTVAEGMRKHVCAV